MKKTSDQEVVKLLQHCFLRDVAVKKQGRLLFPMPPHCYIYQEKDTTAWKIRDMQVWVLRSVRLHSLANLISFWDQLKADA